MSPGLEGLRGRSVTVTAGGRRLVDGVDVHVQPGRVLSVVGPNGAGKSTLLRALSGECRCAGGDVTLEGRTLSQWPLCDHARRRGVLPQHSSLTFDLSVEAVVELGRMPHAGVSDARTDARVVAAALRRAGADGLRGRSYPTLSGGERQRVHLARVLAQIWTTPPEGGRYLLLDEPLSAQDLGRQHEIMGLLRELAREGIGVLVVGHDLNIAARYSDDLLVLARGRTVASGPPARVLTPAVVRSAFGLDTLVTTDPVGGTPLVIVTGAPSITTTT